MSEKYTDDIIKLEFSLFDKVQNEGGRASCQDDFFTFNQQRGAQFDAWDEATRESYLEDLKRTIAEGRNIVMEKYAYMSGYDYMGEQDDIIEKQLLLVKITQAMGKDTVEMHEKYPNIAKHSRPIGHAKPGELYPVDSYLMAELMTYSVETLRRYYAHAETLHTQGTNLPTLITANTMKRYGYASLEEADQKLA